VKIFGGTKYANVTATLALIVAMSGVAWAAATAPKNSVVSKSIKDGQVKSNDIGDDEVQADDIGEDQISSGPLAIDAVFGENIAGNTINEDNLNADSVSSEQIASGAVDDNAVNNLVTNLTNLTPTNSWTTVGITSAGKDVEGIVHLVGAVNGSGATPGAAFTLPVGMRPVQDSSFITGCAGPGLAHVAISAGSGAVTITSMSGGSCLPNVTLDGISYITL
jgi:hypothetical protein